MRRLVVLLILNASFLTLSAQQWLWGKNCIGDAFVGNAQADNYGNCYLAGLFPNDTIHFGSTTLMNSTLTWPPHSNYEDPFLVKYNSKGGIIWAKQWISRDTSKYFGTVSPATVATWNNSVYLNANFTDSLMVGAYTLVSNGGSSGSTCVARYDSNGNVKWARTPRNSRGSNKVSSTGQYISCDKFGNLFLLGNGSYDTITFGAYHLYYNHCIYFNDFLVKYDSSGNVKWAKQAVPLNGNSGSVSYGVTTDLAGNVYTTGGFSDTVKYGAYALSDERNGDFSLIKWDSSGNVKWAVQSHPVNSNSLGVGQSVVTDKHGSVYVCGNFSYDIIIGQDTLKGGPINNTYCFFVAKYNSAGTLIWIKQPKILDANSWYVWSISCDNNSNIYISGNGGYGTCKLAFGGDTLSLNDTSMYDGPSYIFKLDSNGYAICSSIIPSGGYLTFPSSVTSDTSGKHVYLGITVVTPTVFGSDTVDPYSYPTNAIQGINFFSTLARWQACDTNIFQAVPEQQKPLNGVLVYPNPNNGNFTIALQNINEPAQVEVYNGLGEKVQSKKLNANSTQVEMSDQANGVYFYRVLKENGSLIGSGKVVIE